MWAEIQLGHPFNHPDEKTVAKLPGIGPYALDSYRIFILKDRSRFESGDKVLAKYLEETS
jgi:hypothetical protein